MMNYKIKKFENKKLVGKIFGFDTKAIDEVNYQGMYDDVCKGLKTTETYGIYELGEKETFFTVAVKTTDKTDLEEVSIPDGEYYEFIFDMRLAEAVDQYYEAAKTLTEKQLEFDGNYSFELMDKSFNPFMGMTKFKYYIKKK